MESPKIVAEIGLNHCGSFELAKQLISTAAAAGCDYVKFQKRNPDKCVPEDQKMKMRDTPWGRITYIDYRYRVEFDEAAYRKIADFCNELRIMWFASVWDIDSAEFMKAAGRTVVKVPSALITNCELLQYCRNNFETVIISTGMSTEEEVENAVNISNPDVILHCNSEYPAPIEELNLNYLRWLREKYPNKEIGYSGHEYGSVTTFAAVALGASWIERHITVDRTLWGSDQLASIEPVGLQRLVIGIRSIALAMGGMGPRKVTDGELPKRKSLRGY